MNPIALALVSLPLLAQAPDEGFFRQDPKAVMTACADRARAIKPRNSRLLAEYGRAYLAAGDRGKAEEAFQAAVASDPRDGETHRLIVYAWLKNGFKAEALAAAERMKQMDPKAHNVFVKCACNLLEAGFPTEADALMDHAASVEPYDSGNCFDFANAALKASHGELAAKWFARVDPKDKNDLTKSACELLNLGKEREAEELLEKAYRLDPKDWFNLVDFGRIAYRQGRTDLAARWFAKAALGTPKDERMWNQIALIYADGGAAR